MGRALAFFILVLLAPSLAVASPSDEQRLVAFQGVPPVAGSLFEGARVVDDFPFARVALVAGPASVLDRLARVPGVVGVYRDEPLTPALERARQAVAADLDAAGPTGGSVTVALVDSGIDFAHPAFAGRVAADVRLQRGAIVDGGRGDPDGHGTHVAGIVAGSGAYSTDSRLRGLAPAARLVGIDISDSFTTSSAVRAFEWIHENRDEHGIRVVTNSWGREKPDAYYDPDDPVIRASDALVADGLVVVFSAGNRGRDGAMTLTTEAMNPNVLAVGASSWNGRAEPYSSKGPARDATGAPLSWVKPDLVAPGTAIVSTRTSAIAPASPRTDEERYYVEMNGTSMAAPQVAAAAALLLDQNPELSPTLVMDLLTSTARDVGASGADAETGNGLLDVRAALGAASGLAREPRSIVVESRVPVRAEGSVLAAENLVLVAGGTPHVPPREALEVPLVVPKGGAWLDLWFNWSGPGAFDARVGERPFERAGEQSLRYSGPVASGTRTVVATPTGVATSTPFTLDGSILVRETKLVDSPAELHSRAATLRPGGFSVQGRPLDILRTEPETVVAFVVALSVIVGSVGIRRRR